MKDTISIAVYFDLENVNEKLNLSMLLESITLNIEEDLSPIFAIKLACGDSNAISKFREQMKDLNFNIREAPHVSEKNLKNRADLILSLEAFESLYQKSPEIDLYVFITSDTDFTVIMDKLRKYGKQVWLVTRRSDKDKRLFTSSTDQILVIEEHFGEEERGPKNVAKLESELISLDFSSFESKKIREVVESFEKDRWYNGSIFGKKVKNIMKDFSYKGKKVNSQTKLFSSLAKAGYVETRRDDSVEQFRIVG